MVQPNQASAKTWYICIELDPFSSGQEAALSSRPLPVTRPPEMQIRSNVRSTEYRVMLLVRSISALSAFRSSVQAGVPLLDRDRGILATPSLSLTVHQYRNLVIGLKAVHRADSMRIEAKAPWTDMWRKDTCGEGPAMRVSLYLAR